MTTLPHSSMPSGLPLPVLQALLLDLIAPARTVQQSQVDALSEADWQVLMRMVREHRLGPLLHWQLGQAHADLQLPIEVANRLANGYKKGTLRSLTLQRELVLVNRILQEAGIPSIALKGAYLAFHAYPQAALRPLRDLDILVPADQALKAYQVLQDGGLNRIDGYMGTPDAAMELSQHFPPLRSPSGNVNVELHHRAMHPSDDFPNLPDLSADPQFWQRANRMLVGNAEIAFESPTDLLLHLIVHAVYDHVFDNGPLVLSDLAFLLRTHTIDWPLFWSLAETGHHTRGCVLALQLTQIYWGQIPIVWSKDALVLTEDPSLVAQIDQAALLMLRDMESRGDVASMAALSNVHTPLKRVSYLMDRVFVSKTEMAASYPVAQGDWRIYFLYPVRWWRLLTQRLPSTWRSNQQSHLQNEVDQLAGVKAWLSQSV